jgi:hypothetical protein
MRTSGSACPQDRLGEYEIPCGKSIYADPQNAHTAARQVRAEAGSTGVGEKVLLPSPTPNDSARS